MAHGMQMQERKVNGQGLKLPTYSEFVKAHREAPNDINMPGRFQRLSPGRIGYKSLGVLFILKALEQGYRLADEHTGDIVVPKSWVIGTDTDREFLEKNRLHRFLEGEGMWPLSKYVSNYAGRWVEAEKAYFSKIVPAFMDAKLPESLMKALVEVAMSPWPKAIRSTHDNEDNPAQMMAGKYFSTFASNEGSLRERVEALSQRIKRVLASSFNPDAVAFMERHKLLELEANMAVLIMDVFGKRNNGRFAPDVSGVVFTRNFIPWCDKIDSRDPVARLVYGMATRAVAAGGYAREMSLTAPHIRPQVSPKDIMMASQEKFDAIDVMTGKLGEYYITDALEGDHKVLAKVCSVISRDSPDFIRPFPPFGIDLKDQYPFITFDRFAKEEVRDGGALDMVRRISRNLEPLFFGEGVSTEKGLDWEGGFLLQEGKTGLWQCRVMEREEHKHVKVPKNIPRDSTVVYTGKVLGNGETRTPHIVFVTEEYKEHWNRSYDVVRALDAIDNEIAKRGETYILIAPGRLGSSHSELGVPVKYHDIRTANVIVEYPTPRVTPDLSSCTHFLNEFFGSGGMYLAPLNNGENFFNKEWLDTQQSLPTGSEVIRHMFNPAGFKVKVDGRGHKGIIYFH
ncbi:MAG: PEP/pyruvate-binding domain-containing protein [Candidatus Micrarchaeota archaeon]